MNPGTTLGKAIEWLREQMAAGADCPCCGQHVKLYKRPLNASMAYVLLLVYGDCRSHDELRRWIHVPSFIAIKTKDHPQRGAAVRGDWAKLRFWGLLEEMESERLDESNQTGYYRITDLGRQFAENKVAVPAYVYLFNGKIVTAPTLRELGVEPDVSVVRIRDALGKKFDYQEIMARC